MVAIIVFVFTAVALTAWMWFTYATCEWGKHTYPRKWGEPQDAERETGWCGMKKQSRFCTKCNVEQIRHYHG